MSLTLEYQEILNLYYILKECATLGVFTIQEFNDIGIIVTKILQKTQNTEDMGQLKFNYNEALFIKQILIEIFRRKNIDMETTLVPLKQGMNELTKKIMNYLHVSKEEQVTELEEKN
jgi:hypothetical protein